LNQSFNDVLVYDHPSVNLALLNVIVAALKRADIFVSLAF
jgi:hypothetical protein